MKTKEELKSFSLNLETLKRTLMGTSIETVLEEGKKRV